MKHLKNQTNADGIDKYSLVSAATKNEEEKPPPPPPPPPPKRHDEPKPDKGIPDLDPADIPPPPPQPQKD